MTAADLKLVEAWQTTVDFQARNGKLPKPTRAHARALLRSLGRPAEVTTQDQLDALTRGAVIRDGDGWVCERWEEGWYAVKSTRLRQPVLGPDPVIVYSAGEEES